MHVGAKSDTVQKAQGGHSKMVSLKGEGWFVFLLVVTLSIGGLVLTIRILQQPPAMANPWDTCGLGEKTHLVTVSCVCDTSGCSGFKEETMTFGCTGDCAEDEDDCDICAERTAMKQVKRVTWLKRKCYDPVGTPCHDAGDCVVKDWTTEDPQGITFELFYTCGCLKPTATPSS